MSGAYYCGEYTGGDVNDGETEEVSVRVDAETDTVSVYTHSTGSFVVGATFDQMDPEMCEVVAKTIRYLIHKCKKFDRMVSAVCDTMDANCNLETRPKQ